MRLAISIDDQEPRVLGRGARIKSDVLANLRRTTATEKPGHHKLTVWMVDPGVVIDKIVLHATQPQESYLGPPESYRRRSTD